MKPPKIILLFLIYAGVVGGCDRMITPRNAQLVKDADAKSAAGDFARAINLYEAALDDSPRCADIHYKLALLYDDKLNDPLNALHHFKRYLALSPNGARAKEVKNFVTRDEIALATSLSGDLVVTRTEAARLRNENLNLRKQLEERASKSHIAADKPAAQDRHGDKSGNTPGRRTYTVQAGDTLASISRKFYHSSKRWKDILDANKNSIDNPKELRVGQTLVIP
ncbi:MAG TPA: LysM peptidoglycan-binding domain-containing protein [Chthoniobacterales bacterium]|jgi:tetratricopeptide (TPR) repeat protein|nr:LysM peptidoglycan-binding domain-containing protein [Chthoniobacterales bacterium]